MTTARFPKEPKPLLMQERIKFDREDWLDQCRSIAKKLLRNMDSITIEDVTKLCPRPAYLHRNITGAVFNDEFYPVGYTTAKHKEARGHVIRKWRLK